MNFKPVCSKILIFALSAALLLSCTSCGKTAEKKSTFVKTAVTRTDSGIVAENNALSLRWDSARCCLLLTDKTSGKTWSSIPYRFYESGKENDKIETPINVSFISPGEDTNIHDANGCSDCVYGGRVKAEKDDSGIKVTYYFDEYEFSIPVRYTLREDSLAVNIDPNEIEENQNQIYSITVAPLFCSSENDTENSYLFVPSGSGGLMYCDTATGEERTFSADLYGTDATGQVLEKQTNEEPARLPVFGVKSGDSALCGIVEEGAESARINATAASVLGFSYVSASFQMRGYDTVVAKASETAGIIRVYAKELMKNSNLTVCYYPLSGENADYNGMARCYKKYLSDSGLLKDGAEETLLNLRILGAVETKDFVLGVPYQKLSALTTYREARDMIETIGADCDNKLAVNLIGFGESGISVGKVAGGFRFNTACGSAADSEKLSHLCTEKGIALYTDFDVLNYRKSSAGFSGLFGAAKTANRQRAYRYYYSPSVGTPDDRYARFQLISRNKFDEITEKLLNISEKKNLTGISLSTLSSTAYSDYSDPQYEGKGNISKQVGTLIEQIKDQKLLFAASGANGYAAAAANSIWDAPSSTDKQFAIDAEIPFYQMVFKGSIPIANTAVNTASDSNRQLLKCIEGGASVTFTLIGKYDLSYLNTPFPELSGTQYSDNEEQLKEIIARCSDYYSAIRNACIKRHELLTKNVAKTTFDNGVSVLVNYDDTDYTENGITVPSGNFLFSKGGNPS